jgi:Zn-dependent protease
VTLNPWPHVRREPFGTVIVPLFTFIVSGSLLGWGSAPYDPRWERRYPKRAAAMALAGPVANFIIATLAMVAIRIGVASGTFAYGNTFSFSHIAGGAPGVAEGAAVFLSVLFSLNLLLGCFNLLPVAPLDGHSVIGLLLPENIFVKWLDFIRSPMPSLLGLVVAWRSFDVIFWPVFKAVVRLF